jgi:dolichyl-phosphate beta-glucosyltransferase
MFTKKFADRGKKEKFMKTISFVIPFYNEEERVKKTFKALNELSLPAGLRLEKIIFVNDGSIDKTLSKLQAYKKSSKLGSKVKIASYSENKGKGFAIKTGMLESSSDYTLFFDADMSTPLTELKKFMPFIDRNVDVIVGTRKNGESTVVKHQPFFREFLGKGFTLLTQIVLDIIVTDFTCGFKAFSKNCLTEIFENARINRWGYDAELMFLATKYGYSIEEKSVLWANDDRTKVKIYEAVPQTLKELWDIRWEHTFKPAFAGISIPQKNLITKLTSIL